MRAMTTTEDRNPKRQAGVAAAMATAKTVLLITATAMADTIMATTTITAANSEATGAAEVWTEAEPVRRGGGHVET